jgi:5-methyltetrahydrofolate--homocysteine methyltransferase
MSHFLTALHSGRVLLMDGAMGTELRRAGLQPKECGELWNLTQPERIRAIHKAYVKAGARCLLTNTFQSNPESLARHGAEAQLDDINWAAVRLVRAVCGSQDFVLGDVGPIVARSGTEEFPDWEELGRVVQSLTPVDALVLETCSSPRALSAVQYIRHRVAGFDDVPILLSLAYRRTPDGKLCTYSGHSPETYARHARQHGIEALGVNCGRDIDMADIAAIVRRYAQETDLPLFARPNAGTPIQVGREWVYPHSPEAMAAALPELLEAGIALVGGCCGTTPEHIAAFRPVIDEWNARQGFDCASNRGGW